MSQNTVLEKKIDSSRKPENKHFLRNYLSHSIEGGFYMGGTAFLAADSVLPAMVKSLGGPDWIVSLMPSMVMVGLGIPSLLNAHKVDQLPLLKPFIIKTTILQRLPYLLAGLALIFLSAIFPQMVLILVVLTPFLSGLIAGFNLSAWQSFTIKVLPEKKRASAWAIRFTIGSIFGVMAGKAIELILDKYDGPVGYGILHLCCFTFLMISFVVFSLIKEEKHEVHHTHKVSLKQNILSIPSLLRENRPIVPYIISMMTANGLFIITPFLAIHALDVTHKPVSFVGYLVTSQMIGGIVGNIIAGLLGDKHGGKLPAVIGRVMFILVCIIAAITTSQTGFLAVFFLLGFGSFVNNIGQSTLSLELIGSKKRATYLSILTTLGIPSVLTASLLATIMRQFNAFYPTSIVCGSILCISLYFLLKVPEPRGRHKQVSGK